MSKDLMGSDLARRNAARGRYLTEKTSFCFDIQLFFPYTQRFIRGIFALW
jgi:hypothetical protein